ncbi:unnamed protein product [Toxocara canis]|uniref:Uncharacterized protein n=1 Tax=Toxocara canis TaxID=6265 RepID=A0A183U2W5_TOXCA|nr:unnamed protein product [Toxocara canis]
MQRIVIAFRGGQHWFECYPRFSKDVHRIAGDDESSVACNALLGKQQLEMHERFVIVSCQFAIPRPAVVSLAMSIKLMKQRWLSEVHEADTENNSSTLNESKESSDEQNDSSSGVVCYPAFLSSAWLEIGR